MKQSVVNHLAKLCIGLSFITTLSACSTVKVPDIDFIKLPEFREIVKNNQTNVPDVSDIPEEPTLTRSNQVWDADAAHIIALRDGFNVPAVNRELMSQDQIDAEIERLKAKVKAYKLDDPQ